MYIDKILYFCEITYLEFMLEDIGCGIDQQCWLNCIESDSILLNQRGGGGGARPDTWSRNSLTRGATAILLVFSRS